MRALPVSSQLPNVPWDRLVPLRAIAAAHPEGVVDLSLGSPVDPVPDVIKTALARTAGAVGSSTTAGSLGLRQAAADWLARRLGVAGVDPRTGVLPVAGTKELVVLLPTLLDVGARETVLIPDLAYPSYEAGAALARAHAVRVADPRTYDSGPVRVAYLNSPRNPTGEITPSAHLAGIVEWARANDVLLISDECYAEFGWEERPVSILHPDVCGGTFDNLLAVHSLSKRSNIAGYRAGFVAGDEAVIRELHAIRRVAGLALPLPIQAAAAAALADDMHVEQQRERYKHRRYLLREALSRAGWIVTPSQGGLFLWVSHPVHDADGSSDELARRGILVAPGDIFGPSGSHHIRVALTAADEQIDSAARRLTT